ncbi:hypothetical protein CRE_18186 [Caenorhabditis remanei]|uniref:Uncharacterized protein n=1 Tax=Caenorhabditis remanei TaxID=31234 RepID=E3N8L7_CAERE|nr:hypothetical protein CRE_18186 [Caenorhabditis remanei]
MKLDPEEEEGLFKLDTFELYEAYPKLAAVNLNSDDLYKVIKKLKKVD